MAEVEVTQAPQEGELDHELVRRVQRGDSAAFDLLVRKYQHRIAGLIGRSRPPASIGVPYVKE